MWYCVNCSPDGSSATPITQVSAATTGPPVAAATATATAESTGPSVATREQLGIYNIHHINAGASYKFYR